MSLFITKYSYCIKNNTNLVCILVWLSTLFTMGYRMVFSMAIFLY